MDALICRGRSNEMRGAGPATVVTGLVVAILVIPWLAMNVGLTVQPALSWLDPDDTFVYLFAHHAVEAAAPLVIMAILIAGFRWKPADFGLAWGNVALGLKWTAAFAGVYLVLALAVDLVPYLVAGSPPALAYWPTTRNVIGTLAFQWFAVGVGEEILFRGFVLGLLAKRFGRRVRLGLGSTAFSVSVAGLITAVLFAVEHTLFFSRASFLDITFKPDWLRVGLALGLGVYYAALRERTGSLLGPILSHNISDGLYLTVTYLAVALTS